jgi:hypothetical protein
MKKLVLFLSLLCSFCVLAQRQKEISYKTYFNKKTVDVLVYLPVGYDPKSPQKYPVMIWHHGNGEKCWECGDAQSAYPILAQQATGLTRYIEDGLDLPFIVFSPRSIFGGPDYPTVNGQSVYKPGEWTNELFDTLLARYPKADKDNLFLGGLSEGGASVALYCFLPNAKKLKAAIICSAWPADDSYLPNGPKNNIPIWHAQTSSDGAGGSYENIQTYYTKAVNLGMIKPKMTVFATTGHDPGWINFLSNANAVVSTKTWDIAPSSVNKWQDWVMSKTSTSAPIPIPVPPTPMPLPIDTFNGDGLKQMFYTIQKVDTIGGNWGMGSPMKAIPIDNFFLKYAGYLRVPKSGNYTFYLGSDDGGRLIINDIECINNYSDHSFNEKQVILFLEAGVKHTLVVEYYEGYVDSRLQLLWDKGEGKKQSLKRYTYSK